MVVARRLMPSKHQPFRKRDRLSGRVVFSNPSIEMVVGRQPLRPSLRRDDRNRTGHHVHHAFKAFPKITAPKVRNAFRKGIPRRMPYRKTIVRTNPSKKGIPFFEGLSFRSLRPKWLSADNEYLPKTNPSEKGIVFPEGLCFRTL